MPPEDSSILNVSVVSNAKWWEFECSDFWLVRYSKVTEIDVFATISEWIGRRLSKLINKALKWKEVLSFCVVQSPQNAIGVMYRYCMMMRVDRRLWHDLPSSYPQSCLRNKIRWRASIGGNRYKDVKEGLKSIQYFHVAVSKNKNIFKFSRVSHVN